MADTDKTRARSVKEFARLMQRMRTPDSDDASYPPYEPRPGDVVISPFGKCGTTLLQQTFHQLRSGGDMDFDDISRVVPWIETAPILGLDINAEQCAEPRGFKSHLARGSLPDGARYVVSLRNPKDAFVSMYRFMEGWFIEPGTVPMADFYRGWITPGASGSNYWQHLLSWWAVRDRADVLLLTYEHMIDAPEAHIRMLSKFIGIDLDDDLLAMVRERSSLGFMLEHKDRFDDAMMRAASEARCGLPTDNASAKVRKGGVGGHKSELPSAIGAAIDEQWTQIIFPATGLANYGELDDEIRGRNGG